MIELIKSLFETSRERIKNPLIGTFVISWIIINWKTVLILLFSDENIEQRINQIEECHVSLQDNLLLPLGISLLYVMFLPYLMWLIDEIVKKSTKGRKGNVISQLILDVEGKQKLAIEENKLEDIKADYKDKAELNIQIEQLNNELDKKNNLIKGHETNLTALNEKNSELSELLKVFTKTENLSNSNFEKFQKENLDFQKTDIYQYFREIGASIRNYNRFPKNTNEIVKEKYIINGIVTEVLDEENNNYIYQFTDKGNFFWKEYVMGITVAKKTSNIPPDDDDLPF